MSRRAFAPGSFLFSALFCLFLPQVASAQASLTEVLTEAKKVDFSFDFLGSVARRPAGGFEWYLPAVKFGVTDRLEVGGSLSTIVPSSAAEPREAIPTARWKFLETSRGQSAVVGSAWHLPVSNRQEAKNYALIDATFSQDFDLRKAATLTAGMYALVGRSGWEETRRGIILGWDQYLSKRWSYQVEWISGDNWYGYLSSGVTFERGPAWIFGGYCVGNTPTANHGPCLQAGRTF